MSPDLAKKIQLGLDELAAIRGIMSPLIALTGEAELPVIETAAACTMLHSFYTEIEKILKLIALDFDKQISSSESWHRDLLSQMSATTDARPAVITSELVTRLTELMSFRHLFRHASIVLMRWNKLSPLVANVDGVYRETVRELNQFQRYLGLGSPDRNE